MVAAVVAASMMSGCGDDKGTGPSGTGGSPQAGTGGDSVTAGTGGGTGGNRGTGGIAGTGGAGGGIAGTGGGIAGSSGGTGGGSGACSAPSVAGTASVSADGVLTNDPQLHFTKLGGDIVITSAYFQLQALPSFNSVQVWGDLRNNGPRQLCIPLADTFTIGSQDVLVVVEGKPYMDSFSQVSDVCIEPGASAVFNGIQNQVSASLLSGSSTVSYQITGLTLSPAATPHPLDPEVLSAAPKQVSLGWDLAGQMRTRSDIIYNLGVDVFIRDANGLLYDDTSAFPGNLGDLPALTTIDFESSPVTSKFCAYERFDSFIAGSMNLRAFEDSDDPVQQRRGQHQRRRDDLRAAKDLARR
jgi:hypothetical protein